jgi:TM2 domain-containing membrane protein YozV
MTEQSGPLATLETNDIVAIVLSVFVPGVGHMLLGQTVKGIAILAATILSCGVGYLVSLLIAADALCVARVRKERPVGDWEIFPDHKRLLGV